LHLAGVLCSALAGALAVRAGSRLHAGGAAVALVLTLPLLGALGFALVIFPVWRRARRPDLSRVVELDLPGAPEDAEPAAVRSAVVPIRSVLEIAPSVRLRVDAVMALRRMDAKKAVPLLRLAFSDPSEDVRLLAFAILERREKALRSRIQLGLRELDDAGASLPVSTRARLRRRLAQDHWELVYGGFVTGDAEARVLQAAEAHAEGALESKFVGATALLLARIYLRQRRPDQARAQLERAEGAGVPSAACAPLLAEAAFVARRFREVPAHLARVPQAHLRRAGLAPLVEFWTRETSR
jgi:hypothetical protein